MREVALKPVLVNTAEKRYKLIGNRTNNRYNNENKGIR